MQRYYFTEKFTLIPDMFYTYNGGRHALEELHPLRNTDVVQEYHLQSQHAHLIYAIPEEIFQTHSHATLYPFIIHLAEILDNLTEYNKVIFHYSPQQKLSHVLINKGDRLQLVNAYVVESFESALYFLLLGIKQTIINPLQTKLHIYSKLDESQKQTLETYFQEIHIHPIHDTIELI